MSLLIENPDGFDNINQVGGSEALGDQCRAHSTPALDVLCAMVVDETLPLPGCRTSTYPAASLKYRDGISCVTQYMCGGESTASGANYGY